MSGFQNKNILKDYPAREDAIAAIYSMISDAIKNLPTDLHSEIRDAYKKSLVAIADQQIEANKYSSAWD